MNEWFNLRVHSEDSLKDAVQRLALSFFFSGKESSLLLLKPSFLSYSSHYLIYFILLTNYSPLMSLKNNLKLLTVNTRGLRDDLKRKAMFLYSKN